MAEGDFKAYDVIDREFFVPLRQQWKSGGKMTPREGEAMANAMYELDFRCEQLQRILRDKILPATLAGDEVKLRKALNHYLINIWSIREFEYITDLEALIEQVTPRLGDDEEEESSEEATEP